MTPAASVAKILLFTLCSSVLPIGHFVLVIAAASSEA